MLVQCGAGHQTAHHSAVSGGLFPQTKGRLQFSGHRVPAAGSGGAAGVHKRPTEPKPVFVKGPGLQKHHQYFTRSPQTGAKSGNLGGRRKKGELLSCTQGSRTRRHLKAPLPADTRVSGTRAPGFRTGGVWHLGVRHRGWVWHREGVQQKQHKDTHTQKVPEAPL